METHSEPTPVLGADLTRRIDCLFVNAPLRDYALRPRVNDYTLPVLGMAYIATYAACHGFNVGILDAEARGMPVADVVRTVNDLSPRWAGFNLLAPTYEISAGIADQLDPGIMVMAGGHHAKAMPTQILTDPRMRRCQALVSGEGESRVAELLADHRNRGDLPGVMWIDPVLKQPVTGGRPGAAHHLAPDIDALPFVDRMFLAQDPYPADGRIEANMVGARGCPYDCNFCGASVSANPDVTIRTRHPELILHEMETLRDAHGVTAFRFVDDLFLGARRVIEQMMTAFTAAGVGDWAVWEHRQTHHPGHGPLGRHPAHRPRYPGEGLFHPRLPHRDPRRTGRHRSAHPHLLDYTAVDLTDAGVDESMRQRDEFNFSVGIQFGEPSLAEIRRHLVDLSRQQHARTGRLA